MWPDEKLAAEMQGHADLLVLYCSEPALAEDIKRNTRALLERVRALEAVNGRLLDSLKELLPHAQSDIRKLTRQMMGSLYPAINAAKLERAEAVIAAAVKEAPC
jgi:hypothetical protein